MRSHLIFRLAVAIAVAVLFVLAGKPPADGGAPAKVAAAGEQASR